MKNIRYIILLSVILFFPLFLCAQTNTDTSAKVVTLKQCIDFALRNQPVVRQAAIDEAINERNINISLSAWLPQVTGSGLYDYYFKGSPVTTTSGGVPGTTGNTVSGIDNLSTLGLQVNQVIYNNDVL